MTFDPQPANPMDPVLSVLILAILIGIAAYLMRPRPRFVVDFEDYKATRSSGKVPQNFLRDCEAILTAFDVPNGRIKGFGTESVSFRFSRSIPTDLHQNFRNAWQMYRWR